MTAIEDYLRELDRVVQVRGAPRRRLLQESRDHLEDSAASCDPEEAVRRFGPVAALAASYDTEIAARRARRSTAASATGVLAVAGSTLSLIHASSPGATAVVPWALVFFASAQTAALCAGIAVLQATAMRRGPVTPDDIRLLCRRNSAALCFAALTMFAAGGAVPGHSSDALLLAGPVLAVLAAATVMRTRRLARRITATTGSADRSPISDAATLLGVSLPDPGPLRLLLATTTAASAAAFLRDRAEHATAPAALTTAGIEAAFVVTGFLLLGRALRLRPSLKRADAS